MMKATKIKSKYNPTDIQNLIREWQITHNDQLFEDALKLAQPILEGVGSRFANSLCREDIRSVVNLAFYTACDTWQETDDGCGLTSWIWRVAKNKLITEFNNHSRKKYRDDAGDVVKTVPLECVVDGDVLQLQLNDPTDWIPGEALERLDDLHAKRASLEKLLTPIEREALNGFLSGETYQETANRLGLTRRGIDNSLQRVKSKARQFKQLSPRAATIEMAFFQRTEKDPNNPDGCWIWKGTRRNYGAATFCHRGRYYMAARVAWSLRYPDTVLPRKMLQRNCSNQWCVNPFHYSLKKKP